MSDSTTKRLLLRAEIVSSDWSVVGHTLELSADSIFVKTNETAHIGDRMVIRVSFANAVEPIELEGHVVSQAVATEPGEPRGLTLALMFRNDEQRRRFAELLDDNIETVRRTGPYRILYVEDSPIVSELFAYAARKFFKRRGRDVAIDFATSVSQAWDLAVANGPYELAIVDYYLPEELGEALIARLRAHDTLRSMPIVAVSVGGETARKATVAAGADMFLDKPLQLNDLFATIDQLTVA